MSNIDIGNEFSFGLGLTADEVEQLPKFNLARGKIIPIQLEQPFTEYWDSNNNPNTPDPNSGPSPYANYNLKIINYPTPFFIIASSKVYNINKVNSMPYNDPRNGKNSDTTTVLQYTVVQGDETNYPQNIYTESATLGAGGNGQLPRNFYFTPFQGQITQSMVPVYLLPINTKVKGNVSTSEGSNTYLYTFVRADIFITIPSTLSSGVGSGFSYIDYLNNPQNYQSLTNPKDLPNYNNLPNPRPYNNEVQVKNLVFLSNNYIGNLGSVNSHASFCRFLTYDDMYSITSQGNNFVKGNTAGPIFFGLNDLPFIQSGKTIPNPPPFNLSIPLSSFPLPPYGNDSIPPYYIFPGRPYSIFFGLHLNTNKFKPSDAQYGWTFNNYAKNTDNITTPNIQLPDNAKGYPVNFLTSLGNNNPTNGAPNITSNNTSYQKVYNVNSNDTQSFFQSDSSNYIGSTYDMDEYYISNTRTTPKYGLSGASSFFNIYKFSLNKYIRFYSGTDGYTATQIPYNTNFNCSYNGGAYNGYAPLNSNNYDLLNCNVTQAGLVQNMTLQFVPLTYFVPPELNVVPNVTLNSMELPLSGYVPPPTTGNIYINNGTVPLIYRYDTNPGYQNYSQISYQIVGGGGSGGGGYLASTFDSNTAGGGGGSGQLIGYLGGIDGDFNYNQNPPVGETSILLPTEWEVEVVLGTGGVGVGGISNGNPGNPTTLTIKDVSLTPNPKYPITITAAGGGGGIGGSPGNNRDGGSGYNGGGGGSNPNKVQGDGGAAIYGGKGVAGQKGGGSGGTGYLVGGSGGGIGGGPGGLFGDGNANHTGGGGGAGGSGVSYQNGSQTGGSGTYNGDPPNQGNGNAKGLDYTGAGGGGGSAYNGGTATSGDGGIGYAILKFSAPIFEEFKFPNPNNIPIENVYPYPSNLPTTNSTNIINPLDLFNSISSLYSNSSNIICGTELETNSKCGFVPSEYYNSLNRYFYTQAPDLPNPSVGPNCNITTAGSNEYDPPVIVGQTGGINIYNSESCGSYNGTVQNLCVPNFVHFSKNEPPFKCITIPTPDVNPEYVYENYYGMYEEDKSVTPSVPVNKNFPNYFNQTPNKNVTLTIPSYTPVPYPKPANVPGSTKEKTFWNSTAFIIIAIIIGVAILITIIIIVVKFSKSPNKYEKVRYKYNS